MNSLVVLFLAVVSTSLAAPHKRSVGHVAYAAVPAAVSHQSRVDIHSSPAVVAEVYAAPSLYTSGGAITHQSRVDVHSAPAVYSAPAAVYAEPAVYSAPATVYAAPAAVYAAPAAVSHQSRVDIHSSPSVVAAAPAYLDARSVWQPSVYSSVW